MKSLLRVVVVILALAAAGACAPGPSGPDDPRGVPTPGAGLSTPRPITQDEATSSPAPAKNGPSATTRATTPATTIPATTAPATTAPATTGPARKPRAADRPLRSITIALDPGHQLGNQNFPGQVNALVDAGGFRKACNSTGTATDGGVAEATVMWDLSLAVKQRLETLGARVRMTRTSDSRQKWGPCVHTRGRFGKQVGARLMVSLHADGAGPADRGFHVIAPSRRAPWTTDIAAPSLRLAKALRAGMDARGFPRAEYVAGGTGLHVRDDLGTLNMSDVPTAMIELGNLRNSGDARRMTSADGRARYADAVVRGIRTYLER